VIVLMLWFYLSGVAILIGGEVNCEFSHKEVHKAHNKNAWS
jgi:uncharacterized BrkB/YihY/UPF0761 family membrane protein